MTKCSAITRSGERCKGIAIDSTGLCFSHHPDHADARRRSARKGGKRGGRGRPVVELSDIKHRLEDLAEAVLEGRQDRQDAAVAGQLFNYAIRCVSVGLKAKEVGDLEARIEELSEAFERQQGGSGYGT